MVPPHFCQATVKWMELSQTLGTMVIGITEKTPFFIRPFHAKEEDKAILHKEMKRL